MRQWTSLFLGFALTGSLFFSQGAAASDAKKSVSSVPVLMYHHIRDWSPKDKLGYGLSVNPRLFETQVRYLHEAGFTSIIAADLTLKTLPDKPIVLTFDDGYQDFYDHAYPVLKKYGFKATVAIITDRIGNSDYLTADEIKELQKAGIEMASHTVSHFDLRTLSDAKLEIEIVQSKKILEKLLGTPVQTFVYPSGKYNKKVIKLVKKTGYLLAFTTHSGKANLKGNWLTLSRFRIANYVNVETLTRLLKN